MTGKETLVDMIRSMNQEILDEYKVTLRPDDLAFGYPVAGTFEGGANTSLHVTSQHPIIIGDYTYYYTRQDIQDLFTDIGVTDPQVHIDGRIDHATVMEALWLKYGFFVPLEDLSEFTVTDTHVHIRMKETQLIYIGELTVLLGDAQTDLADVFTNNVLNGLRLSSDPVMTDGGNYDLLTA